MTDRAQFEAMLEALINEDQETAKEIFHNIVVGKSREIYEELLESDFGQDQGLPALYGSKEESANPFASKEEEGEEEEDTDSEEDTDGEEDDSEEDDSEEDNSEEGDDANFGGDDSEEGEGSVEDRVMDLEDALEDLKAEFEQMLQGEEHEEEENPEIHGEPNLAHDLSAELGGHDEGDLETGHDELDSLMEYVNKVAPPKHGDNGTNTRSSVAGENNMGGTAANIAQSFSTEKGGTEGGLASPKVAANPNAAGNLNVPGGDAGKKAFKKKEPGHGAEKAGSKETADNKQSTLRPLKK